MKRLSDWQAERLREAIEDYRAKVNCSVKKGIEGNGLTFDFHLRQEAYSEAILQLIKGHTEERLTLLAGLRVVLTGNKHEKQIPLIAWLCKNSRRNYYHLLKKESNNPTINLDESETWEYVENDNYAVARGKAEGLQQAEFAQYLKQSFTGDDVTLISMWLEGYTHNQIAGELKVTRRTVDYRLKRIAKEVATAGEVTQASYFRGTYPKTKTA